MKEFQNSLSKRMCAFLQPIRETSSTVCCGVYASMVVIGEKKDLGGIEFHEMMMILAKREAGRRLVLYMNSARLDYDMKRQFVRHKPAEMET
jgi:hypothetical protein